MERPLNVLEELFASCNVRFAVLLVFDKPGAVVDLEGQAKAASDFCRLGHTQLQKDSNNKWTIVEAESALPKIIRSQMVPSPEADFGKFLDGAVQNGTAAAEGPLSIQINSSQTTTTMLLVNGNHGMVDVFVDVFAPPFIQS